MTDTHERAPEWTETQTDKTPPSRPLIEIKSITDDIVTVAGYGVMWGGKDITGETFTPDTNFDLAYVPTKRVYWDHTLDRNVADEPLGNVSETKRDDIGLWIEAQLDRSRRYVDAVVKLIEDGVLGWSSSSIEHLVRREGGVIKSWPIVEFSLTPTPAEPRTLGVSRLKAMAAAFPELQATLQGVGDTSAVAAKGARPSKEKPKQAVSEVEMEENEVKTAPEPVDVGALVAQAAADAIKAYQAEQAKMEPPVTGGVMVTKDELDHKAENPELPTYKHLGEQLMDIYKAGPNGRQPSPRLLKAHKSATKAVSGASEGVSVDGGFLVQEDFAGQLVKPDMMAAPILSRVRRIPLSTAANSTKLYGVDETNRATGSRWGGIQGYWLAEADEITGSKPKFREIRLEVHKVGALAYATDEVLADAAQLGAVIGQAAREELLFLTEDAIINGTGVGKPLGVLQGNALISVSKETGQAADTVVAENIIKMWARRYVRGNYVWFVNQNVTPQLMQLNLPVGTGGALVYMPPGGLSASPYGSLMGAPVIEAEYIPGLGDTGDILLADMGQYLFCDKGDVQAAQSIHIRFDYDETCFRFVYRVDGQPAWHSAVTPFKGTGDTIAPFVKLNERA